MKEARIKKPEGQQRLFGLSTPVRSAVIPPLSAARWLLVLIVAAGVYFFHGFLVPVLAALVIAFASWPLYRRLLAAVGGNRTIAATLAILFILTFLVVPIALAGAYASNEVREWVGWAIETNREGAVTPHWIATLPVVGDWLNEQWTRNLGHPGGIGELIQLISGANIGSIYRGVLAAGGSAFGLLLALLFMMIALFFAYR
ncbi:MAG: AI-2E family transporter, partial [Mesorhizobium sp.]